MFNPFDAFNDNMFNNKNSFYGLSKDEVIQRVRDKKDPLHWYWHSNKVEPCLCDKKKDHV